MKHGIPSHPASAPITLQMINCVLDLSEIEAERVTLRMAAVDLHSAAKVCLDLVRSTAEAAGLLPAATLEGPPGSRPAARPLRVLVADDVAMNRDIARAFLAAAGHEVVLAENGVEAVAKATAETFDVILMDVRMPVMNGFDAAVRIRGLKGACGRVPIVALTAQSFTGQIEEGRKAGMDAHLSKPFTPDTLLQAVAHWAVAGRHPGASLPTPEALPADDAPASSTATGPDEPGCQAGCGNPRYGGVRADYRSPRP